jgi:hypothetical protein
MIICTTLYAWNPFHIYHLGKVLLVEIFKGKMEITLLQYFYVFFFLVRVNIGRDSKFYWCVKSGNYIRDVHAKDVVLRCVYDTLGYIMIKIEMAM